MHWRHGPMPGCRSTSPSDRRVMVVGDLLLPSTPSASSLAACRDIAQTLSEWQGPGIVVVCGQLVATGCPGAPGPAEVLSAPP